MVKPQHTRNRIENELSDCAGHNSMKRISFDIEDNIVELLNFRPTLNILLVILTLLVGIELLKRIRKT